MREKLLLEVPGAGQNPCRADSIRVKPCGADIIPVNQSKLHFLLRIPKRFHHTALLSRQGEALGRSSRGGKTLAGLIGFQPLQTKSPLQEEEQEGTYEGGRSKGGKTFSC